MKPRVRPSRSFHSKKHYSFFYGTVLFCVAATLVLWVLSNLAGFYLCKLFCSVVWDCLSRLSCDVSFHD
jgi:hypothetical protein